MKARDTLSFTVPGSGDKGFGAVLEQYVSMKPNSMLVPILFGALLIVDLCLAFAAETEGEIKVFIWSVLPGLLIVNALLWAFLWRTNIRGYNLFVEWEPHSAKLDPVTELLDINFKYTVLPRGSNMCATCALMIPLGGWFNRGRIIGFPHAGLPNWRLKLLAVNYNSLSIRVSHHGNTLILNESAIATMVDIMRGWSVDLRALPSRLVQLQAERNGLKSDLGAALTAMETTIRAISTSRRFVQSKEAGKIRNWLTGQYVLIGRQHPDQVARDFYARCDAEVCNTEPAKTET